MIALYFEAEKEDSLTGGWTNLSSVGSIVALLVVLRSSELGCLARATAPSGVLEGGDEESFPQQLALFSVPTAVSRQGDGLGLSQLLMVPGCAPMKLN